MQCVAQMPSPAVHQETASISQSGMHDMSPCHAHELPLAEAHVPASTAQRSVQAPKASGSHAEVYCFQNAPDSGVINPAGGIQVESQCAR